MRCAERFVIADTMQSGLFSDQVDSALDGTSHGTDSDGNPNVFNLERNEDGLWLNDKWANPDNEWNLDNELVLRRRNCFLSAILTGRGFSSWDCSNSSAIRRTFCLPH